METETGNETASGVVYMYIYIYNDLATASCCMAGGPHPQ